MSSFDKRELKIMRKIVAYSTSHTKARIKWGLPILSILCLSAMALSVLGWWALYQEANEHGKSLQQVFQMSGDHGTPLTSEDADLVKHSNAYVLITFIALFLMGVPVILYYSLKERLLIEKLVWRLKELGEEI